jgi:hypothetical protein|tara:strand:+ start:314 stop:562 length:249 start_codon:yes stop_codon:yes gene_type:complete
MCQPNIQYTHPASEQVDTAQASNPYKMATPSQSSDRLYKELELLHLRDMQNQHCKICMPVYPQVLCEIQKGNGRKYHHQHLV